MDDGRAINYDRASDRELERRSERNDRARLGYLNTQKLQRENEMGESEK